MLVALGTASAVATWTAPVETNGRGDRLAVLKAPASSHGPYNVGVAAGASEFAREIVIRNSEGVPVYVSDPVTATTTVMRGTSVPALDSAPRPGRSSLERAYASLFPTSLHSR